MKKKKSIKREILEWIIFLGIILVLYTTGWYTPVVGFVQSLVLKTGIIRPDTDMQDPETASYDFSIVDEQGNNVPFARFKNQVVFLNFWATWCPPCIAEMPDINDLYNTVKQDDIHFIMISEDDNFEKAKAFKKQKDFDFPIYRLNGSLPKVFFSRSIPTTFVISPEGEIVVKRGGMAKYNTDHFKKFLHSLVDG